MSCTYKKVNLLEIVAIKDETGSEYVKHEGDKKYL